MKLSRGFCGEAGTLTPTLSRKRERERCTRGRWRTRLAPTLSGKDASAPRLADFLDRLPTLAG